MTRRSFQAAQRTWYDRYRYIVSCVRFCFHKAGEKSSHESADRKITTEKEDRYVWRENITKNMLQKESVCGAGKKGEFYGERYL